MLDDTFYSAQAMKELRTPFACFAISIAMETQNEFVVK
jgi:hypothetical protein